MKRITIVLFLAIGLIAWGIMNYAMAKDEKEASEPSQEQVQSYPEAPQGYFVPGGCCGGYFAGRGMMGYGRGGGGRFTQPQRGSGWYCPGPYWFVPQAPQPQQIPQGK